jgi:hypothetical protein
MLAGCVTSPKYNALSADRANPAELRLLEEQRLPGINIEDTSLIKILTAIEPTCSDLPEGRLKILVPEEEISEIRVSLRRKNVTIAEIHDILCKQAGLIWWPDKHIYISRKE